MVLPDLKSVHSVRSVHAVCTGLPPDVLTCACTRACARAYARAHVREFARAPAGVCEANSADLDCCLRVLPEPSNCLVLVCMLCALQLLNCIFEFRMLCESVP